MPPQHMRTITRRVYSEILSSSPLLGQQTDTDTRDTVERDLRRLIASCKNLRGCVVGLTGQQSFNPTNSIGLNLVFMLVPRQKINIHVQRWTLSKEMALVKRVFADEHVVLLKRWIPTHVPNICSYSNEPY